MNDIIRVFKEILEKSEEIYVMAMFDKKKTWEEVNNFIEVIKQYMEIKKENNINSGMNYYDDIEKLEKVMENRDYLKLVDCIKFEIQPKFSKEF